MGPQHLSVFKAYVDNFSLTFTFGGCEYNANHMAEIVDHGYRKLGENLRRAGAAQRLPRVEQALHRAVLLADALIVQVSLPAVGHDLAQGLHLAVA